MTATPLTDLSAELRRTRPDLLRAACGDDGGEAGLAAFLARPEQAEYFRLADKDSGEVWEALPSQHRPSIAARQTYVQALGVSLRHVKQLHQR